MSNNYPNSEVIEKLRRQYPKGTVVVLDHMNDVQAPEINTAGEVLSVDDIGTVHVSWLSGGTLGVAFGEDAIHKADTHEMALYKIGKESIKQQQNPDGLHFCPRCGEEMDGIRRHALSRNADIVICDACGRAEAVEALIRSGYAGGGTILPIEEWAVVKGAYHIYAEEDENGWKVTIPEMGAEGRCERHDEILKTGMELHNGEYNQ